MEGAFCWWVVEKLVAGRVEEDESPALVPKASSNVERAALQRRVKRTL
jgi:hypothetical protein